MKFSTEAKKFISLVESAMVKKGSVSLIPEPNISILKNSIALINASARNDIASVVVAKKEYFSTLENDEKRTIIIEQEILDRLNEGFTSGDTTFTCEHDMFFAQDGTDRIEAELKFSDPTKKFPIPLTQTTYGLITDLNKWKAKESEEWDEEKSLKGFNVYKTTAEALSLPKRDSYEISLKDGTLIATLPGTTTKMSHKIDGESVIGKKGRFLIDGEFYRNIVSNLEGEVYLIYNKNAIMFTCSSETLSKTYSAAARVETEG